MIENSQYLKNNKSDYITILSNHENVWDWFPS